ncbi:MAG: hypothetical protein LBD10_14745 [Desulfobulbus sp.]|jgi:hypothetical protein|uniref:hypothetical protein n=1 Tax=Desulfobulbus sp. TaxID=895 RepID=UPI0028487EA9|nr:hypothetical protein [Desulfobulbus sp.]MDR2551446.1 hypothetical protein [Desulfobulbus sp.]
MPNPGLIKTFVAEAAVAAYRIAKFGTSDANVVQATAVGDALIGVCGLVAGDAGRRVDIIMSDIAEVEYGGNVTRGDWLTTDASGRAVSAAPAAGTNNNVIGRALVSGVVGDIGHCMLAPCRIQG